MKCSYYILFFGWMAILASCKKEEIPHRKYETSFESVNDFAGFYITPQGHNGTTFHELSDSIVFEGAFSHKAWVMGANPSSTSFQNNNHRGYPTIQLINTAGGAYNTPCYITFWVWLDMNLQANNFGEEDDWFSFATFTDDESDNWNRTVLVNLDHNGIVHLQHVPYQREHQYIFQTDNIIFPQKEWVQLKVYLDFSVNGYAKVWQNGELVSHAQVKGVKNGLAQAHFGLYCPPQIVSGKVYNDKLTIEMVSGE